jgi:hypothetical protein
LRQSAGGRFAPLRYAWRTTRLPVDGNSIAGNRQSRVAAKLLLTFDDNRYRVALLDWHLVLIEGGRKLPKGQSAPVKQKTI